jgi:uncharacterized Zn finger protein
MTEYIIWNTKVIHCPICGHDEFVKLPGLLSIKCDLCGQVIGAPDVFIENKYGDLTLTLSPERKEHG